MHSFRTAMQRVVRMTGRSYDISSEIPVVDLFGESLVRLTQLLRGTLLHRKIAFFGPGVRIRGRRFLVLARGVSIGDGTLVDARGIEGIHIGKGSRLGRRGIVMTTSHLSRYGIGLSVGENSGIGDNFHIGASGGVSIGRDVIIGPFLTVHSQEHIFEDPSVPIREQGTRQARVTIADNCWIGSRVTLLAGTEIGPRTVIASGAVVRGKHPGNEILGGVPARRLKEI